MCGVVQCFSSVPRLEAAQLFDVWLFSLNCAGPVRVRSVEQRSDIEVRGYQGGRGRGLGEGPWEVCGGGERGRGWRGDN